MDRPSPSKRIKSFLFRFIRVIVIFGIAAALALLLFKARKKPEKKELVSTPPAVHVVKPVYGAQTMVVEAFGTVKPRKLVKLAVEVSGRIDYVHPAFVEGGFIRADDVIMGIDQRTYGLERKASAVRIRQTRAEITSLEQEIENLNKSIELSKANVDLAFKEMKRISALSRNDFASKTSLDRAEQAHLAARIKLQDLENLLAVKGPVMDQKKAALALAEVEFQKADLAFGKTRIRSAFDGFVLEKQVEAGEVVSPGQVLGTVYEKGALDVDVRIPLEEMKWVENMFSQGKVPRAQVTTAIINGQVRQARVARIKAKIDEKTRTLPMTLEIGDAEKSPSPMMDIKPGSFVKCRIMGDTHEEIFVVPRHLLKSGNRLFLVVDNALEIRTVKVLRKFEDKVYVRQGLEKDDLIVSSPLPGAVNKMALTVKSRGNDQ